MSMPDIMLTELGGFIVNKVIFFSELNAFL